MGVVRIFVASPGDVQAERDSLVGVVEELNLIFEQLVPEKDVRLRLVRWEADAYPELMPDSAKGPQDIIDRQIGKYDIFLGIMWLRFGTPTNDADSGTEHEFNRAATEYRLSGSPDLTFYFSVAQAPPLGAEAYEQYGKVLQFRTRLQEMGLVAEYSSAQEFPTRVRQNLLKKVARDFIPRTVPAREFAEILRPADVPSRALRELDELVAEYGRIRATMSSGDERTEKMTIVMAQIKAIAPLIASRLSMLSQSSVAGERLAAIAILGWEPSTKYLRWLAARLDRSSEKPFIGYYAGLALLVAARTLDSDALPAVAHAVNEGLGLLAASSGGRNISGLDRYRVLQNALYELNRRTT